VQMGGEISIKYNIPHTDVLLIIHNQRMSSQILTTKNKHVFQNARLNYSDPRLVAILTLN